MGSRARLPAPPGWAMSDDHLENALVELDVLLTSPIEREEALAALTTTLATLVGHVDAAQISRLDDSERQRLPRQAEADLQGGG